MARPQQDPTWPFRPQANYYPQHQLYNIPYQTSGGSGICQDSCCQQPRVPTPYRTVPYPAIPFPYHATSFRPPSQSNPRFVPVNPYLAPRIFPPQFSSNTLIHRPIPQNRFDYNEYYRLNNQSQHLNRTNSDEFRHDTAPFSPNQYPACSHYTAPPETSLHNIDVRQFLATWQDKDDEATEPVEPSTSYHADVYQPLDCSKRSDGLEQNCEYNQATYCPKPNVEERSLSYQPAYGPPQVNSTIPGEHISTERLVLNSCTPNDMQQINDIPFERRIDKITNPGVNYKSPTAIAPSNLSDSHFPMTSDIYNIKEYNKDSDRSQYHLSASLESDDLFDDINRKRDEKQKNVVHPLQHESFSSNLSTSAVAQAELFNLPLKPNVNVTLQNINMHSSFETESFTNRNTLKSSSSEYKNTYSGVADDSNLVTTIPNLSLEATKSNNGSYCNNLDKDCLNSNSNILTEASNYGNPTSTSFNEVVIESQKKHDGSHDLVISSDDIDISIASSGEGADLNIDDEAQMQIGDLKDCMKLPKNTGLTDNNIKPHNLHKDEPLPNTLFDDENKNKVQNTVTQNDLVFIAELSQVQSITGSDSAGRSQNLNGMPCNGDKDLSVISSNSESNLADSNIFSNQSQALECDSTNENISSEGCNSNALQNIAYLYEDQILSHESGDMENCDKAIAKKKAAIGNSSRKHTNLKLIKKLCRCIPEHQKSKSLINWRIKNSLSLMASRTPSVKTCALKKYTSQKLKLKCMKRFLVKKCTTKKSSKISSQMVAPKPTGESSGALKLFNECTNGCEVNCIIYQSDLESCNNSTSNSIVAEEVHICNKCQQDVNSNIISDRKNTEEVNHKEQCCKDRIEPADDNCLLVVENNKLPENALYSSTEQENSIEQNSSSQHYMKKLKDLIVNFVSLDKPNLLESDVFPSWEGFEIEESTSTPVDEVESTNVNEWPYREEVVETLPERESIKCSFTWDKIFKCLFDNNQSKSKDSLELGPAKIHLTLSPKNNEQWKITKEGQLSDVFTSIVNVKKLILKRNCLLEERIPKMVIKKSEEHGYRSFIKDVVGTPNPVNSPKTVNIKVPKTIQSVNDRHSQPSPSCSEITQELQEQKEIHHCSLCQKSFLSIIELKQHEITRIHQHLDRIQRNAIHKMYNTLYGCNHPQYQPLSDEDIAFLNWKPNYPGFSHNYYNLPV